MSRYVAIFTDQFALRNNRAEFELHTYSKVPYSVIMKTCSSYFVNRLFSGGVYSREDMALTATISGPITSPCLGMYDTNPIYVECMLSYTFFSTVMNIMCVDMESWGSPFVDAFNALTFVNIMCVIAK